VIFGVLEGVLETLIDVVILGVTVGVTEVVDETLIDVVILGVIVGVTEGEAPNELLILIDGVTLDVRVTEGVLLGDKPGVFVTLGVLVVLGVAIGVADELGFGTTRVFCVFLARLLLVETNVTAIILLSPSITELIVESIRGKS